MSEELFEFLDQVQELVNTSADNSEKLASGENLLLSTSDLHERIVLETIREIVCWARQQESIATVNIGI